MGRGSRPVDSQPTPAKAGSVAMPRDGDPMNDKSLSAGPADQMEAFDGFPYLVTRIGRTPLRHVVLLPAEWSRGHLLEVARRQALANQLETRLCQGPADAVYVTVHGSWSAGGVPPRGLRRCGECRSFRGDSLAPQGEGNGDRTPRVVPAHCRCENHNRCARCGTNLAERRLSAYFFDEPSRSVRYLAAYVALGHRCEPLTPRSSTPARPGIGASTPGAQARPVR